MTITKYLFLQEYPVLANDVKTVNGALSLATTTTKSKRQQKK